MINVANIDKNNNRVHWTESEWNTPVRMTGKIEGTSLQIEARIRNVSEGTELSNLKTTALFLQTICWYSFIGLTVGSYIIRDFPNFSTATWRDSISSSTCSTLHIRSSWTRASLSRERIKKLFRMGDSPSCEAGIYSGMGSSPS